MIRRSLIGFVCIGLVLTVPVWASEASEESPDIFSGTWGTAILSSWVPSHHRQHV